jgi:maleylpyruvate isomerase
MSLPAGRRDLFGRGESFFLGQLASVPDRAFGEPCRLPGWRRSDLLAHVARNADALGNLLAWARTGIETPMYASAQQRADDIAASAEQAPAALRADVESASARLVAAVDALPPEAWDGPVRTARGRAITAAEVPWMRIRETWVHAVDLGVGASFGDLPAPVVDDLLEEVAAGFAGRADCPPVTLVEAGGPRSWRIGPGGDGPGGTTVTGPPHELLAWLIGRADGAQLAATTSDGRPPAMPAWL